MYGMARSGLRLAVIGAILLARISDAGAQNANMLLGNPSSAAATAKSKNNYLIVKPNFALSYNNKKGIPNWVSWRLCANDLGQAARKPTFDTDDELPAGFNKVTHMDYNGSGFDRGHMCPHGDRASTREASFSTFVMTNIIPQAPNVNQQRWESLEAYCRDLVSKGRMRLYIFAGPYATGGEGSAGPAKVIAGGKVTVPKFCWKVIVAVKDNGSDSISNITADARVIAVIMPNQNQPGKIWSTYRTTAAKIEAKTKMNFFSAVPAEVAAVLRNKLDKTVISGESGVKTNERSRRKR